MIRSATTTLIALFGAAPQEAGAPGEAERLRSYQAHVAAAEMALRLGDTGGARRWLEGAPEPLRGWEWRHLDARADDSLRALEAHEGGVWCVALSPDGSLLATGGDDGAVRLWDERTLALVRSIDAHGRGVYSLDWSPDGARLASSGGDALARIWNVADGSEHVTFRAHAHPVGAVRFAPDGKRLASCSYERPTGGEVRLWWAEDGREAARFQHGYAPIVCLSWSLDAGHVYAGSWDQGFKTFDVAAPDGAARDVRLGTDEAYRAAQALALSPDGAVVAIGGKDELVHLFDAASGEPLRDFAGHDKSVEGLAFSPDGRILASGSVDRSIRLWDVASGAGLARAAGHASTVRGLAFTRDGTRLWSGSYDGTVREWDVAALLARGERLEVGTAVYGASISPDGGLVAAGLSDGRVVLVGGTDRRIVRELGGDAGWIAGTAFSPDGSRVLGAGEAAPRVWRVASGELVGAASGQAGCDDACFSPDGRRLASGARDRTARVWEAETLAQIWSFEHPREVGCVAFTPDGRELASGCRDGRVRFFDLASGALRLELAAARTPIQRLAFAPDGSALATAGDDGLDLWSPADGTPLGRLVGHDEGVRGLAFSPDGTRLASGSADESLIVWDWKRREPLLRLEIGGRVAHLAFAGDGERLLVDPTQEHLILLDAAPLRARGGGR